MSIEEFMRGCFDVGLDVRVRVDTHGEWTVRAFDHVGPSLHRYRSGKGRTFTEALDAYNASEWVPSFGTSVAKAAEELDNLGRMLGRPDDRIL